MPSLSLSLLPNFLDLHHAFLLVLKNRYPAFTPACHLEGRDVGEKHLKIWDAHGTGAKLQKSDTDEATGRQRAFGCAEWLDHLNRWVSWGAAGPGE